jgi:hypothetical protein
MKKTTILIIPTKVVKPIVEVIAPPIKPTTIPLQYPCIIYSNVEHCAPNCLKQIKVQNMFHTKTNFATTLVPKPLKLDNVPINVVIIVTTCSQVQEQ